MNTLSQHLAWWYENSRSVIKSETSLIWQRLFIMMHVSECIFHIDHIIIIARDFYNISVSDDWNVTQHLSREKKTRIYWWCTQILQYGKIILNTYLQNISLPMQKLNYWETCTKILEKINKKGQEAKTISDAEMWTKIGFLLEKKCMH